jgi:hypothetical protein
VKRGDAKLRWVSLAEGEAVRVLESDEEFFESEFLRIQCVVVPIK